MSTRSSIAIKNKDGSISAVYCHWDGYLENNGILLFEYYNTEEKVRELLSFGDISSLAVSIEKCEFYHRDRGEELRKPENIKNIRNFVKLFSDAWCEYFYLFDNGVWYVNTSRLKPVFVPLSDELKKRNIDHYV